MKCVVCAKCNRELDSRGYTSHFKRCGEEKKPKDNSRYIKRVQFEPDRMNCVFCSKLCKNYNSRINHERLCKQNANRETSYFIDHQDKIAELKKLPGYTNHNQYTKARANGMAIVHSEKTLAHLRRMRTLRTPESIERANKAISETIKKKVAEGTWHTSLAKRMHYNYNGIDLHGKWELSYAKWLDEKDIKWIRCKQSFSYLYEDVLRRYTPDFYLPDTDEYVEIKGYKTSKDECKWKHFPKDLKLTVLMESDLKKMGVI